MSLDASAAMSNDDLNSVIIVCSAHEPINGLIRIKYHFSRSSDERQRKSANGELWNGKAASFFARLRHYEMLFAIIMVARAAGCWFFN